MKTLLLILTFYISIFFLKAQQHDSIIHYFQNYEYDKALIELNKLNENNANDELIILKAKTYKALNKYEQAILSYEKVLSNDSENIAVLIELADCYESTGNFRKSQLIYRNALFKDQSNFFLLQKLADSYCLDDNYKEALLYYLSASSIDSSYYLFRQIARCYESIENTDSAIFFYQKALVINPSDFTSTYRLADIYRKTGYFDLGVMLTSSYLNYDSSNIKMLKLNGVLHFLKEDYSSSVKSFEKCLALNDSSLFVQKYRGFCYFKMNSYEEAKDYLEKAFIKDTSDIDLCYALGLSCANFVYKKLGIEYLSKCVNLFSPSVNLLSHVYQDLGKASTEFYRYDDAIKAYLKALELTPNDTLLIFKIASHYDNWIKDKNKALEFYQIFMETRPREKKPLPQDDDVLYISYYDFVERRMKEIKEELFWEKKTD